MQKDTIFCTRGGILIRQNPRSSPAFSGAKSFHTVCLVFERFVLAQKMSGLEPILLKNTVLRSQKVGAEFSANALLIKRRSRS
ncbi:hypothetical protein [Oceaniovalibus sp. ACAM 378]|uniref:hypothetical protein n=1 Tax=Oceaniovalibus sp. ACAM 378 TaxID=2599923 RepID=UPI0016525DB6|nr:hypothetical protein [Oceaniovalibus sp. ACAM 378]